MARKIIDTGVVGTDGTGDSIRDSFRKVNDNFRELYSSLGLGENLSFIGLDDVPNSYVGQNETATGSTPIVTINNTESGLAFKRLIPGTGISIDFTSNPNEIAINSDFAAIVNDPNPQLGGDLSAQSGGAQHRIIDLGTSSIPLDPIFSHEAVSKYYADLKLSKAGTNTIDPATGLINAAAGRMTGPLILARDPEPDDDEVYDGLIAATKRYVDNAAFGSVANLYVATSGQDDRVGVSPQLQGRALAYAYRTIEAACKRAEELVLEARQEIGPYKKVLTYANGTQTCSLSAIGTSPSSGSGFAATPLMSVDTVSINIPGANYYVGDVLTLSGGTVAVGGQACTLEVLTTATTPGAILTFRILSTGVYTAIPGATNVATTITTSAAPGEIGAIGLGGRFNITYKVNNVAISNGGSGYSLVSVRITGGGGTGAFGTANVDAGVISGVSITDQGSGFTSVPTVIADLPRFLIFTAGQRTDFTGDVLTNTPQAFRGRDIREGLFLRGETSGALAQILAHSGELDTSGNEIFDVDIKYGSFQIGEAIAYGDVSKSIQITILLESGIYEENFPIKLPQNTSIVGDEFRRCIIRPRPGTSSSPWAFLKFKRDLEIDGLTTATQEFGYHYLDDITQPVYPRIDNGGEYRSAAALLTLNRSFIQEETIRWIDDQIDRNIAPFSSSFVYDSNICKRDVGLIVDAWIFDLKYGEYNRTISAGLKYYQNASGLIAIGTQLSQTIAGIQRARALAQFVISNTLVSPAYQNLYPQIIDNAYTAEVGSATVINTLTNVLVDVMDGSGSVNYPKENNQMDVFLANDAVRWQGITCQGHGGFMLTLDPTGQILAKSPYAQECASFSKSIDAQTFTGGMFVDGFSGNLQFQITAKISSTRLTVGGLERLPNLPCSFIVEDTVYRVNYIRDYEYNAAGSTATFVLDETTPWNFDVFTYNDDICSRDVGLIIDGLGYDIVLGTNYHQRKSGLSYRLANAAVVIQDQRLITVRAIDYAHELAKTYIPTYTSQQLDVDTSADTITSIVNRGALYAPTLTFTNPTGLSTDLVNAKINLLANMDYIKAEVVGYINTTYTSLVYDSIEFARDVGYIVEALVYDLIYGGNSQTRGAGLRYWDGVGDDVTLQIPSGQLTETIAGIAHLRYLTKQVVQNLAPATSYSLVARITGTSAGAGTASTIDTLITPIETILTSGVGSAPAQTLPDLSAYVYDNNDKTVRTALISAKAAIQSGVIEFVDREGNLYELLMPGNRSMLSNDFTQVNDLGYGILATNGGLVEAVSMFTYYCHISYYSLNGAQIRSVAGSSAHGNYALVAEGSDPLEVPTPTDIYYDPAQRVVCYFPSPSYANVAGGLVIYVTGYQYTPLNNSELEVDHGGAIYRYPVTSVTAGEGFPPNVARLNLTSDTTGNFEGIFDIVPDGTKMTLRSNSQIILTGDLVEVAVRPSTGLRLVESPSTVYRVLQFEAYNDLNGPYEVAVSPGDPGNFEVRLTITTIASDVCTTSQIHTLRIGDKFIPTSTANGFSTGVTYYILTIPAYNQFTVSTTPGGTVVTLSNGSALTIKGTVSHRLLESYRLSFSTSGTIPGGLDDLSTYYITSEGLSDTVFRVADSLTGLPLEITSAGTGTITYTPEGLTKTTLRENYDYVDLTVWQPGEAVGAATVITSITIASPAVITKNGHGLSIGDVIKFTTDGALPTGLTTSRNYHVITAGFGVNSFRVSVAPDGTAVDTTGSQSGTHSFSLVRGRVGDTFFPVVPVSPQDGDRLAGSKIVFLGEEYVITAYDDETITNEPFARINLSRPLVDSVLVYEASYTARAAVPVRTLGASGSLTIRISLTRVTGHDLLEIGTGSYADTNYPNEIYGPSVNAVNEDGETEERDVGRCFYVTTDQFGNFSVGPYFRVDQGTGRVTFSAAIALSNLDGIGFKRGVPIAEFSTDSSFSDNATDTVPTENAARIYIERRLGISHSGAPVADGLLIPTITGGFMSLDGQLAMKGDMDLDDNRIVNVSDPQDPKDAINLRSLTFGNLQEFTLTNLRANDTIIFTGVGNEAINAAIVGDIALNIDSTANTIDAQINPGVIINADVNAAAAIAQSKLAMTAASTRASAAGIAQADLGLASFDSSQFTATNGWLTVKENGLLITRIAQIATKTVLGNAGLSTANVAEVNFTTIVNDGGSVKKSQYGSTGFLRRTNGSSNTSDADYAVIDMAAGSSSSVEVSKLIVRDSNGDFGGRNIDVAQLKVDTKVALDAAATASGGYIRAYTWGGNGGIFLSDGSLASDRKNYYDNDEHVFRPQNGSGNAPVVCSSIQATTLTTGGNTTSGTITGRWTLNSTDPTNGSRLQATYSADLAENYEGDQDYEVGTVLVFGGEKEVTTSTVKGDTRVAGVVSNTAAYTMYEACPGLKNLVALQGRVPCKVVGKIKKGDLLITSGIPGVAVSAGSDARVGTVVGKALTDYDSDHIGTAEIAVGRT